MLRIFFFIFSLVSMASAKEFFDEFTLYVMGDVEYIEVIFNGIAMVFSSEVWTNILIIGMTVYLVLKGVSWYRAGGELIFKDSLMMMLLLGITASPVFTATVKIVDKRTDTPAVTCGASTGFAAVANVPYVVAAIASVPSFVFFELIRLQDQAFAPIEDLAYSRLGFAGQFNAMIKAIENASRSDVDPATSNYARRVTQYVEQCASEAVNFDPDKNNNISSPLEFVLDSISPDKLDLPNSGASTPMVMLGVPSVTNCAEGYANLTSDIQPFAQKVFERAQANVPGACKVSLASNSQAFADTMASNVQSALMGNTNPIMNALASAALIDPVAKGRKNDQLGLDAGSGSSIYNSLATNMAIVQMQQEGVGRFQWMSEMIPIGLHIALPYAYAMSMFVLMLTLYTNSLMYLSNYVKGILSLESVRFGMALSHNFVSMYAQHRAFDLLAGYSENMFALNTMPVYLNYMATMAGVSGLIGVSLAIATPILIFRGDPAALLGAISGLAGRFNNRAQDINQAHDDAMSKQRAAEAYLKQHGVPLEGGMGAVQQAERLRQQIDRSGEAFGSLEASQNLRDYEQGRMIESANRVGSTLGLGGSDTSVGQGMGAGKVSGRTSGITMQETSGMLNNQEYFQGVRGGVAQSLGSTQGMGAEMAKREMSMGDMRSLGHAMGAEKLGASVADYNAKRLSGQITQNNTLSDQAFTGFERESRLKSEALMGVGAATSPLQQAWEQIRRQSAGQFSERFESAAGYVDRAMDGNGLKGGYAEAVKGASAAKIASMIGATSVFGGADAQADFAQKESALKTAQSIGSLEGTVKELRETGKDFVSAAKEMSSMLAGAKTAGDLVSIKTAEENGGGYIKLAKDSAEVTTKQKAGSVLSAKLVEDNTESQQKLIDKIVDGARAIGGENKASEAIRSFQNAGLLDENGKVREGSWIRGKAFLSGLNMGGLNAMSIAGITTTAALNLEGGDPTIRMSALNSSEYGETRKFSNGVIELLNKDPVTAIFLEATNGDMEKAASLRRAYDASKTGLDPKNWLAGVTAFLTDGADDTQSLLAAGVIGVGGSIALGEIAQSTNNLVKGNYIDKTTGRTVNINDPEVRKAMDANPDNYRVKRGTAGEAWRGLRDRVWSGSDNLSGGAPSPESPRQPLDSPVDRPPHDTDGHKQNKPDGIKNDEVHHGNSPKSDKDSISKPSGNNKFSTTPPAGGGHPKPPRAPSGNWKAGVAKYIVGMAASMGILNAAENTEYEETVTRAVDFASAVTNLARAAFTPTSMGPEDYESVPSHYNPNFSPPQYNYFESFSKDNILELKPKSALNDAYEKIRQDPNLFKSPEEEERQNIQEQETIAAREAAERTNRTLEEVSQTLEDQSRQLEEVKKNKTRIKFGGNS